MPPAIVARHLEKVLAAESIAFEPAAIRVLSRAAEGSMRDGLSLLDQAIAYGGGGVDEAAVREMLGAVETDYVLRLLEALAVNDGPALFAEARAMSERNIASDAALQELGVCLHDIALLQSVPSAVADDHPDRDRLAELARQIDPETTQLYYQIAIQGRTDLPLAPDEFAGFSMTLLRMLAFAPVMSGAAGGAGAAKAPTGAGGGGGGSSRVAPSAALTRAPTGPTGPTRAAMPESTRITTPVPARSAMAEPVRPSMPVPATPLAITEPAHPADAAPAQTATPTASGNERSGAAVADDLLAAVSGNSAAVAGAPNSNPAELSDADSRINQWPRWVAESGLTGLAQQLAYNAELKSHRVAGSVLEVDLGLAESNRHLAEKMHHDKLRDALVNTLGVPVRVKIELGGAGESSMAAVDKRARQQLQDDATANFNQDPFVRDTVRLFDARIRAQTIQPVTGQQGTKR